MTAPSVSSVAGGTVQVATTDDEVEGLRALWEKLGPGDGDADIDYFLTVVRADPAVTGPHVVVLERPDSTPLLIAARVVRRPFPLRVGGAALVRPTLRTLVVSFDGIRGATSDADVRTAVAAVLESSDCEVVLFQRVEVDGSVADAVASLVPARRRQLVDIAPLHRMDLPGSWEDLLARRSSKSRRQIRFDDNKLRRRHGDALRVDRLDAVESLPRLREEMEQVARASYQSGLGVSVLGDPVQSALIDLAAERGWLRVWMLSLADQPVAFWWGIAHAGILTIGTPGYDAQHSADRVGYFTLRRMLEDSCADPAIDTIDFGVGDADYKARFATRTDQVAGLVVLAPRVRPLAIGLAGRAVSAADRKARALIEASGRSDDLRRRWRALRAGVGNGARHTS